MSGFFRGQSIEQRRILILSNPIPKTLAMLCVPALMLSLMQSVLPLVDGIFINNTAGFLVASAVTFSTPILNMVLALAQGLSVAAMAIIGQLNGKGEFEAGKKTATQLVVFATCLGVLIAPVLILIANLVSRGLDPQITNLVCTYLSLYAIVIPFSFMEAIYNGIKNANGQPEAPFIRMVLLLVLKVIFNIIFLSFLHLGLVGCVLSSFGANVCISVWMYSELFFAKKGDRLNIKGFRFSRSVLQQLLVIGFPAMITSFILNFGFYLINKEIEIYGPVILNGQGIAGNITGFCFNIPSSFSSAVTIMVSMCVGANMPQKAKRACITGCILSAISAVLLIALIIPSSGFLITMFTRQKNLAEAAYNALHIYTYSVVGFGVCMVIQGAFIGLGRTRVPLILGFLRIWLLRYLFILVTKEWLSYYSVYWGNLFSNYTAALIAIIWISRIQWKSAIDGATGDAPVSEEKPADS